MTDCRNLSFLDTDSDSKVLRWLTTFQEYEFEVKHVPGKDNFVADSFSRLCVMGAPSVESVMDVEISRPDVTETLPVESESTLMPINLFIRALRSGLEREAPGTKKGTGST